jgi:NitT/TauT family transport system substrate-binding protein
MKTNRILISASVAFLFFLSVLGVWCYASQQNRTISLDKLKIGYIPITDCAQIYVANERGIFEQHDLEVELVPLAGGAKILAALSSGSVDVAFSNLASVVFYEKNAGPLQRLSGGTFMDRKHSEAGLVVLAESGIGEFAGLSGKTIAVNTQKNIVALAVLRSLRKAGVPSQEVSLVEVPFKDMEAALRAGRVHAATLPEPILSKAISDGGLKNLGDFFTVAVGEMYATGYFTTPMQFSARKDAFERFNKAIEKATDIANAYDSPALDSISSVTRIPIDVLQRSGRPKFVDKVPDSAVEQMREWLKEEGFLE